MSKKVTFYSLTGNKTLTINDLTDSPYNNCNLKLNPSYTTDDPKIIEALKKHANYGKTFVAGDGADEKDYELEINFVYKPTETEAYLLKPIMKAKRDAFIHGILSSIVNSLDGYVEFDEVKVVKAGKEEPKEETAE